MDTEKPRSISLPLLWMALALLALAASAASIRNGLVQDDLPVIQSNVMLHSLKTALGVFVQPYWPPPWYPALYRPLASLGFALEWAAGGGIVGVFRLVSILMYLATTAVVFGLTRQLLTPGFAWLAAALFAVHPVHTEVVGIAINQSEMGATLLTTLALSCFIRWRRLGPLSLGRIASLVALFAVALLYKETAIALPPLILAAEVIVVNDARSLRTRLGSLWSLWAGMGVFAGLFTAVRTWVLKGDVVGTFTAEALYKASLGGRALTMLGVVPEWARLLLWPAHLQADYSPGEIVAAQSWSQAQTFGAAALIIFGLLVGWGWQRSRTLCFGLVWTAIALGPVHNVLVPTGITLAERTLFLPSVGAMLAIAAGLALLLEDRERQPTSRFVRWAIYTTLGILLMAGAVRSAVRYEGFRTQLGFWYMTMHDAPRSYRANMAIGDLIYDRAKPEPARFFFKTAVDLYPQGFQARLLLADKYRIENKCPEALPLYDTVLTGHPKLSAARVSLAACLLYEGDYARARTVSVEGRQASELGSLFDDFLKTADSAAAAGAPAHSVYVTLDTMKTALRNGYH